MLTLRTYGVATAVEPGVVILACNNGDGGGDPIEVNVRVRGSLADFCGDEIDPGDDVLAIGYGYHRSGMDGPELWCDADVIVVDPVVEFAAWGPVFVAAHGVITEGPVLCVVPDGTRIGDEVCDMTLHVRSPHHDGPTVLRVKSWRGAAHWIAENHQPGDRINIEGVLRELRWTDGTGVYRHAHEVVVRRWHYGKPKRDDS